MKIKTIARLRRWWHCGMQRHHAQDAWHWRVNDPQPTHWYMGCEECRRAFWTRDVWSEGQ